MDFLGGFQPLNCTFGTRRPDIVEIAFHLPIALFPPEIADFDDAWVQRGTFNGRIGACVPPEVHGGA